MKGFGRQCINTVLLAKKKKKKKKKQEFVRFNVRFFVLVNVMVLYIALKFVLRNIFKSSCIWECHWMLTSTAVDFYPQLVLIVCTCVLNTKIDLISDSVKRFLLEFYVLLKYIKQQCVRMHDAYIKHTLSLHVFRINFKTASCLNFNRLFKR